MLLKKKSKKCCQKSFGQKNLVENLDYEKNQSKSFVQGDFGKKKLKKKNLVKTKKFAKNM